jgi:glycosyltransferase involved in cell wall biosynthesis
MSLIVAGLVAVVAGNDLLVDWPSIRSLSAVREPARTGLKMAIALSAWVPQHAFCFSDGDAERLRESGLKQEPTVLPGRYRGSLESPMVQPTGPQVVFIGYLTPDRRAELAVAGIAAAASRIPDLRATFYGTGPGSARLDAAISAYGVDDIVTRVDYTDADGIETALRNAMCLLITSRGAQSSLVVVEAASRATPVVVVPAGGRSPMDYIENRRNGLIADGEDPLSVGAAILAVHEAGREMRESTAAWFGENAYRLSAAYAYERICDSYVRIAEGAYATIESRGAGEVAERKP